jgi:hypothetical protein
MTIFLDIVIPLAAIALVGMLLHNSTAVDGVLATVTEIYRTGALDILA